MIDQSPQSISPSQPASETINTIKSNHYWKELSHGRAFNIVSGIHFGKRIIKKDK